MCPFSTWIAPAVGVRVARALPPLELYLSRLLRPAGSRNVRILLAPGRARLEAQALAIEDVGAAADLLLPVYDRTDGADGFVSIEVPSALADDTLGTIAEARSFWSRLKRPNVMIKVPATAAGVPAIEALLTDGINVNITLIFGIDMYEEVMEAYLRGLEHRVRQGQSVDRIASVASFFVTRVDTLVDPLLDDLMRDADPEQRSVLETLHGRVAITNAVLPDPR